MLLALEGAPPCRIAALVGVSSRTVHLWGHRFEEGGPDAILRDAPGRGRHATLDAATIRARLGEAGLLRADGLPTSLRKGAAYLGVSPTAVWRPLRRGLGH